SRRNSSATTTVEHEVQDLACFNVVLGAEEQHVSIARFGCRQFPPIPPRPIGDRQTVKAIDVDDALARNDKACVLSIVVSRNRLGRPALWSAIDFTLQCRAKRGFELAYR